MGRVCIKHKQFMIFGYCISAVASVAAIGFSIWLHFSNNATLCQKVLEKPLLILGLPLLIVSVMSLVGFVYVNVFFLWTYLILTFLLLLGLLCLTLFRVLATDRNASRALFGRDGNYSHYLLHKYLLNEENWEKIKSCMVDFKLCQRTNVPKVIDFFIDIFYQHDIQSSCCKPPTHCGLEFHNATYWTMPKSGPAAADNDCKIWSNVQRELCFNCQSCTTAFLDDLHKHWKLLSIIYFVYFLIANLVGCAGCCFFIRKYRSEGYQRNTVCPE